VYINGGEGKGFNRLNRGGDIVLRYYKSLDFIIVLILS
jgi:hypothetical protein